jgi:CRP/FNR family transcriptional regulator
MTPNQQITYQTIQKKLKQSYPQFVGADPSVWDEIFKTTELVELPEDLLVLEPASLNTQFMLIIEGSVRVYQQNPDTREVTLYRTQCGDLCVLSINGMMQCKEFGAFAKTESKVTALALSRYQFMKAMALSPSFCEYVLINLTKRFADVFQIVETTVFESLETRLMSILNRMSKDTSSESLAITHKELARELGTSREVVSRILKSYERQGCIIQKRGHIQIMQ